MTSGLVITFFQTRTFFSTGEVILVLMLTTNSVGHFQYAICVCVCGCVYLLFHAPASLASSTKMISLSRMAGDVCRTL